MAIYAGRRPGRNLIADLLHWANYGKGGGRGIGLTIKHLANAADATATGSAGSAGIRSEQDAAIDVITGGLKLDRPHLIDDLYHLEELLTSPHAKDLQEVITARFRDWTDERFKGANVVPFWGHDLQRITIGEVLENNQVWASRLGKQEWNLLKRAKDKGWVGDHIFLDPKIFRDATGGIKDVRFMSGRMMDRVFTLFDPFGQGRVVRSLFSPAPRVAVLPPLDVQAGYGVQFFIGDSLYLVNSARELEKVATGMKLRKTGDPLHVVSSLRRVQGRVGRGRIRDPQSTGLLASAQRATGVGTAYASRRSLFSFVFSDPLHRARELKSGGAVLYRKPAKYAGSKFFERSPLGAFVPEYTTGANKIVRIPGGGKEHKFDDLGLLDRMKVLLGLHDDYEVIKTKSYHDKVHFDKKLTEQDKLIPLPRGGAENVELFWREGERVSPLFAEEALTGVGERTRGKKAKYYATPSGFRAGTMDFANYMFYRVNALASTFGFGIGFKASGQPWKNALRLMGIPIAYRTAIEIGGYADFLIEDITGVSPVKTIASAYAALRVGQQQLREALGIRGLAAGLERAYPGLVESEGATMIRSALLPIMGFMSGLKRGFGPGLRRAGILYSLFGGVGLSQPAEELKQEYTGERKVPVRRGRLWGFGYQPFFGGDISHFEYSWFHKLQTDYRTKSIYGSREEYYSKYTNVFGVPFPTPHSLFGLRQILNPYALEERHYYSRPYMETGGRFDEFPIIGPLLSEIDARIPIIGKARKRMHVGELMGIPTIGGTLSDRTVPPSAAVRLGITDLPAAAIVYQDASDPMIRLREQAAIAAEPFGVYKFALEFLGIDLDATKPAQAASASAIGSYSREFYGWNLGGMFGVTEFPRRFLLSDYGLATRQRELFNPLRNRMPTWLPGIGSEFKSDEDYFLDFLHGDPFSRLEQGEARLPGVGYESLNPLHSGTPGVYDLVDRLLVLADVAPYSQAFQEHRRRVEPVVDQLGDYWSEKVRLALAQRDVVVNQLTTYGRFNDAGATLSIINESLKEDAAIARSLAVPGLQRAWDSFSHDVLAEIPYFGSKLFPFRDPLERYQKEQIYGETFASWFEPYETIFRPAVYDIARSGPIGGAAKGAVLGALMSSSAGQLLNPFTLLRNPMYAIPSMAMGGAAVSLGRMGMAGSEFMPPHKKKEMEAMQYMDMMQYVKARSYQLQAEELGDDPLAAGFERLASKTFAGAKSYADIRSAMGSDDRKYLNAFLSYPESERGRLLSALPTYYGEALNKIWDNDFGSVAEHDSDALQYFADHPAVPADSLLWHPSVPSTVMKIKMIQGGINGVSDNLHRFGFYESQGIEANLRFPSVHYQRPYSLHIPNFESIKNRIMHTLRRINPFDENPDRTSIRRIHSSFNNTQAAIEHKIDRTDQLFFYMQDMLR